MSTLLLFILILPFASLAILWAAADAPAVAIHRLALALALTVAALALVLCWQFANAHQTEEGPAEVFAASQFNWLQLQPGDSAAIRLSVGLDGFSLPLFTLAALLLPALVLVSENSPAKPAGYYAALFAMLGFVLVTLAARDIVLFAVAWEATLVPVFLATGLWGGSESRAAAMRLLLVSLAASMVGLVGLVSLIDRAAAHSSGAGLLTELFDWNALQAHLALHPLPVAAQGAILTLLVIGFAARMLLWPLHTWLGAIQAEAPLVVRVAVPALLVPASLYGFVRWGVLLLPDAATVGMPWLWGWGAVTLIAGLLTARRNDLRLIATSIATAQAGLVLIGVATLNNPSVCGAVLYLAGQAAALAGLLATLGMLELRTGSSKLDRCAGALSRWPKLIACAAFFLLAGVGMPGLSGFVGLWMLLTGLVQRAFVGAPLALATLFQILAVATFLGVLLAVGNALAAIRSLASKTTAKFETPNDAVTDDLSRKEACALAPIFVMVLWIGLWPGFFVAGITNTLERSVTRIDQQALRQWKSPEDLGSEVPNAP